MANISRPESSVYRDPLMQYIQSWDPELPECKALAEQALLDNRKQRAYLLDRFYDEDRRVFSIMAMQCLQEDPGLLAYLTNRVMASALVQKYRQERGQ